MKRTRTSLLGILGVGVLLSVGLAGPALATDFERFDKKFTFNGRILDGPLANHRVHGECRYSSQGDAQLQKGPCTLDVLKLTKGGQKLVFKMRDPRARLAVVGNNRQLAFTMGVPMPGLGKGNNKLTAFQLNLVYDSTVGWSKLPSDLKSFTGTSISVLGTNVSQGGTSDDPDCLLWDDLSTPYFP